MTIDINRLEMRSSSKFYLFYLQCTSPLSGIVIALWHTFGHPLYIMLMFILLTLNGLITYARCHVVFFSDTTYDIW